ncbi:carbohydrate sulfotransferase 11-like isoform X3 [Crassostrea virginica]
MVRRNRLRSSLLCCLLVTCVLGLMWFRFRGNSYLDMDHDMGHSLTARQSEVTNQEHNELDDALSRVHRDRRERLREVCRHRKVTYLGTSPEEAVRQHFVFDSNSQIVYCAMEKVGSTFWRRLFQILAGKSKSKSPFDLSPADALGGNVHTFSNLPFYIITGMVTSYKKFVFVRNPFERLFSGYVDKIFSMAFSHYGKYIVKTQRPNASQRSINCGHDVTFAEFVKYFIQAERTRKHRDGHFLPMYDHCKPCQVGYDYIGKLETIQEDTIYILNQLNFTSMASRLQNEFVDKTRNDSYSDQTNLLFRFIKMHQKCISAHELQKIFWKKEQIRGLIDPDIRFPFSEAESQKLEASQYLKALHRSVGRTKDNKMAKEFRRAALLQAYATISRTDMDALKEILKPDCEIFGYDCESVQ